VTEETPAQAPAPGLAIRRASWVGTGLFVVTAVAAAISPSTFDAVALGVAAGLFAAGCALFLWAFLVMAGRSRDDEMELSQVWFLSGSPTPAKVRLSLLASFGVEVAAGFATAGARPYTSLAAGVLVPVYGLALCGLWAARHGTFPPRTAPEKRGGRAVRSTDGEGKKDRT
jgi:hypothetical protein